MLLDFFTSIYYYIFLLIGSSCLLFIRKQRGVCVNFLLCILFVLLCLPALRETGIDRNGYIEIYNLDIEQSAYMESTYRWISYFVKTYFDDVLWLFLIYAILGIGLKLLAIRLYSPFIWVSLLLYLSQYYVLHDMIQIRAGVASGILLLLTKCYYEKTKKDIFYIIGGTAIATLFHYSGLLLLLPLFLNSQKINKNFYYGLLTIVFLFSFLNSVVLIKFFLIFLPNFIQTSITRYSPDTFAFKIYGFSRILDIAFIFFAIFISDLMRLRYKYYIILLKICIYGKILFFSCSFLPAVAGRCDELLSITHILLIPSFLLYEKKRIGIIILLFYFLITFTRRCYPLLDGVFLSF